MANTALDTAKYIVTYCSRNGFPINNLKLQALLYFTWMDFYKSTGKELFTDDICAWQFGPAVQEVYYEFCPYAGRPITKVFESRLDLERMAEFDAAIETYHQFSIDRLVKMSQEKGSPWDLTFKDGQGIRKTIPFDCMKQAADRSLNLCVQESGNPCQHI